MVRSCLDVWVGGGCVEVCGCVCGGISDPHCIQLDLGNCYAVHINALSIE